MLTSIQCNKSNLAICLVYGLDFKILVNKLKKFFSFPVILMNLLVERCLQSLKEIGFWHSDISFVKSDVQTGYGLAVIKE